MKAEIFLAIFIAFTLIVCLTIFFWNEHSSQKRYTKLNNESTEKLQKMYEYHLSKPCILGEPNDYKLIKSILANRKQKSLEN